MKKHPMEKKENKLTAKFIPESNADKDPPSEFIWKQFWGQICQICS